jgi:hypothetical protein
MLTGVCWGTGDEVEILCFRQLAFCFYKLYVKSIKFVSLLEYKSNQQHFRSLFKKIVLSFAKSEYIHLHKTC